MGNLNPLKKVANLWIVINNRNKNSSICNLANFDSWMKFELIEFEICQSMTVFFYWVKFNFACS